jgi:ubiquitin-conjugating enzyme E2 variant
MVAAVWILSAWLAADLITGVVHWLEDRYGDPSWPVVGPFVVGPNQVHHRDQTAFLAGGWWHRNWTTCVPAWTAAAICLVAGWLWLAAVAGFAGLANEVHAWSHQRCCRPIRGLQLLGLLASPEDHARHHRAPFAGHFCVMSGILNPGLEAIGFWRAAEWLVSLAGAAPRPERQAG